MIDDLSQRVLDELGKDVIPKENAGARARVFFRHPRFRFFLASITLFIIVIVFHGRALNGGWRFDDTAHLWHAINFSPWQDFFLPAVWPVNHTFTPWLTLDYGIDWRLFGLNPRGYYAHNLIVIWICALLSYALLRRFTSELYAASGAALFLLGAPTFCIAQQLMSRHYATGLLFALWAVYLHLRSVEEAKPKLRLAAALLYLCALLNKEIYLLLPLPLLFLGHQRLGGRIKTVIPYGVIGLAFIIWRRLMLGEWVGGYQGSLDFQKLPESISNVPDHFFGSGHGKLIGLAIVIIFFSAFLFVGIRQFLIFMSAVVAILFPFTAVEIGPDISIHERFLFVGWWATCVAVTLVLSQPSADIVSRARKGAFIFLGILVMGQSFRFDSYHLAQEDAYAAQGDFIWRKENTAGLMPSSLLAGMPHFQEDLSNIKRAFEATDSPVFVYGDFMWLIAGEQIEELWTYDATCRCMRDVTSTIDDRIARACGNKVDLPLSADVTISGENIEWKLEPFSKGKYFAFWYDRNNQSRFRPVPAAGKYRMRSGTAIRKVIFIHVSPQGRFKMSEWLRPGESLMGERNPDSKVDICL